jgi:Hom_end-associated Hint
MSCNICCDDYNKSTRSKVCCPYCDFDVCRTCCETYILSEIAPKCMKPECSKEWSRKFLRENFTNVFLTSKYKEHLENVLFDQEKSLLPATQPMVEEKIRKHKTIKEIGEIEKQINVLRQQQKKLHYTLEYGGSVEKEASKTFVRQCPANGCRGFLSTQWKCGICEQWSCPECHELKGPVRDCEHTCNADSIETAKLLAKDSKPCPKCQSLIFKISGCFAKDTPILMWNGETKFSQEISIGDILIGDDGEQRIVEDLVSGEDNLYEIKQNNGNSYIVNSKHTLVLIDKNENIKLIIVDDYLLLDDISCSNLFGYKIINSEIIKSRIEISPIGKGQYYGWSVDKNKRFLLSDFTVAKNCDQMWCTQCHTAFSWKSGKLEQNVHNPHYYEWKRKNGGLARANGDVECGRELSHYTCDLVEQEARRHPNLYKRTEAATYRHGRAYSYLYNEKIRNICSTIRQLIHNVRVELPNFQTDYVMKNQDLRIRYLENEINEAEFKTYIQRNDKRSRKNTEISQVIQLMNSACTDIIYRIIDHLKQCQENQHDVDPFMLEIEEIRKYCNNILKDVAYTYSTIQYEFNHNYEFTRLEKEKKQMKKNPVTENDDDDDSSI